MSVSPCLMLCPFFFRLTQDYHYPEDRSPTVEEAREIQKLVSLGVSAGKIVTHFAEVTGKNFKRTDIYNIAARNKLKKYSTEMTSSEDNPSDYVPQCGKIELRNPHIDNEHEDVLYHIALSNKGQDLKEMFSDVKFVCFGGSPTRMHKFAEFLVKELQIKIPAGQTLYNIAHGSDRYVLYKVGSVLSVSHGMGIPSLSIIFHEMVKLVYHAGCSDVVFFRIGTSGGLGLDPGSVVVTEEAVDGLLRPYMEMQTLGEVVQHPSKLDQDVLKELLSLADPSADGFKVITGKTMCTTDFYEGQARLDGAFCDYDEAKKMAFLQRAHSEGVTNIEMESLCFAAYCYRAGIRSAVVCVTLLDRLQGDQITSSHALMEQWQMRPQLLVAKYIKKHLGLL